MGRSCQCDHAAVRCQRKENTLLHEGCLRLMARDTRPPLGLGEDQHLLFTGDGGYLF